MISKSIADVREKGNVIGDGLKTTSLCCGKGETRITIWVAAWWPT